VIAYRDIRLLRDSKSSKPNYVVDVWSIKRIHHTEAEDVYTDNCLPPPNAPPFEENSIKHIGKFSAISSSKQQPLSVVLDELHYRCSTEDV
jgi:hypothetical protein